MVTHMETDALIRTKLIPPALSPDILPRPQLIERLENGRYRKLTLISAPAGYGKSILATLWANACSCPVAWLSLDKNDNDVSVFLGYFVAAMQTLFPNCCGKTEGLLNVEQTVPLDFLTAALINDTVNLSEPIVIALDDYHLIENSDIQQLVSALIQHQSEQIHLLLVTRQDPLLSLPSLRAKNQLTEIRSDDLRFGEDETRQFLENVLGERVDDELVTKISERTENWPAGLRLACLAFRDQEDISLFLEGFHGSNQHVMSYLLDEVLVQQPPTIYDFLLRTAVLDRFCAPLCDALNKCVADLENTISSQEIIESLIEANLFTFGLDQQGQWFRYHHLFQELLIHKLKAEVSITEIAALHTAAAMWLDENGFIEEAIDHALGANDMVLVAQLVEKHRHEMMNQEQWLRLRRWLNRLPQQLIEQRVPLLLIKAWHLGIYFRFDDVVPILEQIKALLEQEPSALSARQRTIWMAEVAVMEAAILYWMGQGQAGVDLLHQALDVTPAEHAWVVGNARNHLIITYQQLGYLDEAYRELHKAQSEFGHHNVEFRAQIELSHMMFKILSGDLHGAEEASRHLVELSQAQKLYDVCSWGFQTLGYVHYQWNELEAAEQYFLKVLGLRYQSSPAAQAHSLFGLALTYQALGRYDEAVRLAEEATEWAKDSGNLEMLLEAYSFASRLALLNGHDPNTEPWAPSVDNSFMVMLLIEIPALTLATSLIADGTVDALAEAAELLDSLRQFVEETHNTWRLIEVLNLQALLYEAKGERRAALDLLQQAVALAQPAGFIRLFVDLGPQMALLLAELQPENEPLQQYIGQVLALYPASVQARQELVAPTAAPGDVVLSSQNLPESLTDRELDVLKLLTQRQTTREIAQQLFISPHTVNFHLKNIYAKLNVHGRRQAEKRAQKLGLISSG